MLVDAHAHLDQYELLGPGVLDSALAEIAAHEILTLSNSMDLPSYERNLALAQRSELVLPSFGVHPWNALEYARRLDELDQAIRRSPLLGEIGLDHYFVRDASTYPAQRAVFERFLAAARDQDKTVNLHTKGAEADILELLREYDLGRVIVHWYSGPRDILGKLIDRGVYFTLGLEVGYSERLEAIAREIPAGQLLTETDNPGGLEEYLGRPGTPALIREVVQVVARARRTSPEEIEQAAADNLLGLIKADPWLKNSWPRPARGA